MLSWINPRVVAVILSVVLLLAVTHSVSYDEIMRRSLWVCGSLYVLYLLAFLLPLRRAVRWPSLLGMAGTLAAAWAATALALIADARPLTLEEQMQHPTNWPRAAFVAAAAIAFYLFATGISRGFGERAELIERETGQRPD
jgi:hypothetical protein